MIFFVLFAFLLALASASPPMTAGPGSIMDAAHGINDCDYGTYEDHSYGDSAWIADCMHLADNISGDGTWYLNDNGEFRQLAQYGSCAFGVKDARFEEDTAFRNDATFLPAIIHIGNEDIRSVIQNAIVNSKKMWNPVAEGRVGASGVFNCQTGIIGRWEAVRWSIYWDPKVPSPQDQPR